MTTSSTDQLLGGFAAIAFPAEYGNSGVMTFIVNHDGVVYSQDLGPRHGEARPGDRRIRSGPDWKREEDGRT